MIIMVSSGKDIVFLLLGILTCNDTYSTDDSLPYPAISVKLSYVVPAVCDKTGTVAILD